MSQSVQWKKDEASQLFANAFCQEVPLVFRGQRGLLTARATRWPDGEALPVELSHRLRSSGDAAGEDVLEGTVTLRNLSAAPQRLLLEFSTSAFPSPSYGITRAHLPLTANGLFHHHSLRDISQPEQLDRCDLHVGHPAESDTGQRRVAHYLEPMASHPEDRVTKAPLLIPLVEWYQPGVPWRLALFGTPEHAWRFEVFGNLRGDIGWAMQTVVDLPPGGEESLSACLMVHEGDSSHAWRAFHRLQQSGAAAAPDWMHEVVTHYYEYLAAGSLAGKRGDAFEVNARHFRDFRVGLATQHGYYPLWGDYIHPDRKSWQAMQSDERGSAEMSLDRMRERIRLTREAGARAAIYIHLVGFDAAAPQDEALRNAAKHDAEGKPVLYDWHGPEMVGRARCMSMSAEPWRRHLLQQADWLMDLLDPDAIVVDETFAGVGYDWHADRPGPTSGHAIRFMKDLRALVKSHGDDKAVLSSDCSLGSMILWADGEGGDHAYGALLGHALYREPPIRYLAALGGKPWLPCAWQALTFWNEQLDLARKVGSGIGVSDGWIEYAGLARLVPAIRQSMLDDLARLVASGDLQARRQERRFTHE
jgi:hypothetical protein